MQTKPKSAGVKALYNFFDTRMAEAIKARTSGYRETADLIEEEAHVAYDLAELLTHGFSC